MARWIERNTSWVIVFFFNDTAPTEIYPLSLHDALPIYNFLHDDHFAAVQHAKSRKLNIAAELFDIIHSNHHRYQGEKKKHAYKVYGKGNQQKQTQPHKGL